MVGSTTRKIAVQKRIVVMSCIISLLFGYDLFSGCKDMQRVCQMVAELWENVMIKKIERKNLNKCVVTGSVTFFIMGMFWYSGQKQCQHVQDDGTC